MAVENSERLLSALNVLQQMGDKITAAKKSLLRSDQCLLPRAEMTSLIQALRDGLPEALTQADGIVTRESEIISAAESTASASVAAGQAEADRLTSEAKAAYDAIQAEIEAAKSEVERIRQDGEALRTKLEADAQASAEKIVEDGRRRGQEIVSQAEAEASRLVEQDNIFRRAQMAAQELTEETNNQLNQTRQKTFDYLYEMMGRAEQYVGSLVQEVHQERENLKSHR